MQKQIFSTLLLVMVFSFLTLTGCKKEDSTPTAASTTTIPKDLTNEEILAEAQNGANGDPRGTFYVNTPAVSFAATDASTEVQYKSQTKNQGSGMYVIEGSTATEGTWKSTNVVVNIDLVITIIQNGTSTDVPIAWSQSESKTGTWKILSGQKLVIQETGSTTSPDTTDFGITSKGVFQAQKLPNNETVSMISVWKK